MKPRPIGSVGWMRGKTTPLETRKKQSEARLKIRHLVSGQNSGRWKGGVSSINLKIRSSFEYKLWRKSVFERDNYSCIWCGQKGNINADHIKPFALFPELRFAIDNGRTLCVPCHKKTDSYGWKFFNIQKDEDK